MPSTPHIERHFTGSEFVRDVVIGMSDGLTVPFALAAGLSGAVAATRIVVVAGLAEIAAGSIAMGLGGYLAAKNDAEHYFQERRREEREIIDVPEEEAREVREILEKYGLEPDESQTLVEALEQRPKSFVDFMMQFELGLEEPAPERARKSAATIGGAYIVGGPGAAAPLHAVFAIRPGTAGVGDPDAVCPGAVRLCEGPVHGHQRVRQRHPYHLDWWHRGRRGVRDRPCHRSRIARVPQTGAGRSYHRMHYVPAVSRVALGAPSPWPR